MRCPVALVGVKGEAELVEDPTKEHQQRLRRRESIVTDKEKIIKIDENLKVKFCQLMTKLKVRCHSQWVLEPVCESRQQFDKKMRGLRPAKRKGATFVKLTGHRKLHEAPGSGQKTEMMVPIFEVK